MPTRSQCRAARAIALAVVAVSACFATRTRTVPSLDPELSAKGMIGREVVLTTAAGPIGLTLDSLRYPYLMGNATVHGGVVQVRIDHYTGYAVVVLDASGRIVRRRTLRSSDVLNGPGILVGNSIQFFSDRGNIVLRDVARVDLPWAEGRLVSGDGPIRADLRDGQSLMVEDVSVGMSVMRTTVFLAMTALLLLLMYVFSDGLP